MKSYKRSSTMVRFNAERFAKRQKVRVYAIYRYRKLISDEIKSFTFKYSTGLSGPTKLWNGESQRFKKSTAFPEANQYNEALDKLRVAVEKVFSNTSNPVKSNDDAKRRVDLITGRTIVENGSERNIIRYFNQYIERRRNDGDTSPLTVKRIETSRNRIKDWLEHKGTEKLNLDEFNRDKRDQLINYLFEEKKRKLSPTTVAKILRDLRTVLREAHEEEFINPLGATEKVNPSTFFNTKAFIIPRKRKSKHWLREAELDRLYDYDLSSNLRLKKVRDIFLKAAYSGGLRISDIFRITPNDFTPFDEGYLLTVHTHKGRKVKSDNKVVIPIKGNALKLWQKSGFESFTRMSEQKLNEYLKELLELVGINRIVKHKFYDGREQKISHDPIYKHVSFHTARYSFINIHIHEKGLTPNEVSGVTGQSLKTLLGYLQKNSEANAERIFSKF